MSPFHKIKILALSTGLLLAAACGDSSGRNIPEPAPRDPACDGMQLLRNMSFSGSFLYRFVGCLSSSQQNLPQLAKIQQELGVSGMQALIDLLSLEHPDAASLGVRYPYLVMLATLMDRGTYDLIGRQLVEDDRRFLHLQEFLQEIRPRQAARLILDWHRQGQLHELLNGWLAIGEQLPAGTLTGMLRLSLSDANFQKNLLAAAEGLLAQAELTAPLAAVLGADPFNMDGEAEQTAASRNAYDHWLDYWQQRDPKEQDRLINLLANGLRDFSSQGHPKLEHYSSGLAKILKSWLLQSHQPSDQLVQFLGPILNLSLDELNPLILGIEEVAQNPLYVDALQEKLGSSKLQQDLIRFLSQGGQLIQCQGQNFSGLNSAQSLAEQKNIALVLLNPNSACDGLSPMLAFGMERLSLSCNSNCQAQANQWLDHLEVQEPKLKDWNLLVNYSLERLGQELKHDPYYLQHRRLAYGPVNQRQFNLIQTLRPNKNSSIASLLSWENAIKSHKELKATLVPDFIELWLGEVIFSLNATSYQVAKIFPASDEGLDAWLTAQHDERLLRSFLGFYEGGPARPWLQSLSEQALPIEDHSRLLAQLRQNFAATQGMFKNPAVSFQAEVEGIELGWNGNLDNQTRVNSAGEFENISTAIELADLIQKDTGNGQLALWQRLERQLPLIENRSNKDILQQFRTAIAQLSVQAQNFRSTVVHSPRLPAELFETQALEPDQARLLLLFFGQNFYPWQLTEAEQIAKLSVNPLPAQNELSRNQAPRVFAGVASTAAPQRSWSANVQWIPELWGYENDWHSWINRLTGEAAEIETLFLARSQEPLTVGLNQLSRNPMSAISDHERFLGLIGSLSFIYSSRTEQYLAPSLGFADYCPTRSESGLWQAGSCPFQVSNYGDYQEWLSQRLRSQICPVLAHVSEDSQVLWLQALGFDTDWSNICPARSLSPNGDYFARVLEDLLRLGNNPKLRQEISNLPVLMRISKLGQNPESELSHRELDRIRLSLSPKLSATLLQREESYGLFRQRHPGLTSTIIQQIGGLVGPRLLTERLLLLGTELDPGSSVHPIDRLMLDIVDEFQISRASNLDILGFLYQLLQRLAENPRDFEILTSLIGDPYAVDTGILLGFTMGQAIEADVFPQFDPDQPGYRWVLQILQPDNWQAVSFFAELIQDDLAQLGPYLARELRQFNSAEQMSAELGSLLDFYLRLMTGMNRAHNTDLSFRQLAAQGLPEGTWKALSQVLWQAFYQPLADLDNQWHSPLAHKSQKLVRIFMSELPLMASRHQKAKSQNSSISTGMWGLIKGIRIGTTASHEAFALAQDSRLGLRDPDLVAWLIREPSAYQKLDNVLDDLDRFDRDDWLKLTEEMDDLLDSSYRWLDFAARNTVWQEGYEIDFAYGLDSLGRMARSDQRRQASFDLFRHWLEANDLSQPE